MPCLDESVLLDFAGGALDGAARAEVERHIDGCHACFEVLAALGAEARGSPGAAGRYTIDRVRGAGAMGTVYEAHDPVLDRTVALKVLRSDLQPTEQRRLRLLREAQSLARIRHPNVVSVYDAGEAGPDVYIAMELIDGEPLGEHLARQPRAWRAIVDLFVQAGQGLAAAHDAGLVHRDFKPSNVLIDARGRVVVTDFGLAAPMDASDDPSGEHGPDSLLAHTLSATAARLGTPAYMAPEQFAGQRATASTDQFAFCVALVEALTGQRPFAGASVEAWTRSQARGPDLTRLPGPARLARVLARGLAFDPADRHPSMRAVLVALRACQRQRRIRIAAALATLGAGVALAIGWQVTRPRDGCVAPLADSWGAAQRDAVEQRLLAPEPATPGGRPGGGHLRDSKLRALASLDAHAAALAETYAALCPELPQDPARGTAAQRGQWACVQGRRAAFTALTTRLAAADSTSLPTLLGVLANLEPAADCRSPELALRSLPQPDDPALGARVQALRLALAVARVRQEADEPEVREALAALLRDSEALAYAPLQAEVLGRVARGSLHAAEFELAARQYTDAHALASASGHESEAAAAARGLILTLAQLGRFAEARVWAEAIAPVHRSPRERLELLVVRGTVAQLDAQLDEAQRHYDRAFALYEADPEAVSRLAVMLHAQYGDLQLSRAAYPAARRQYERALELQRERVGSGHIGVAELLISLAEAERFDGDLASARAHLEQALALADELATGLPIGWANLGELQSLEGDFTGALASYRRARESDLGGPLAAVLSISEAHSLAQLGRHPEAERACAAALETLTTEFGADHPRTAEAREHCQAIAGARPEP